MSFYSRSIPNKYSCKEKRPLTRPLKHPQSRGFPRLQNPQFLHVIIGFGASIVFCSILLLSFRPFLVECTTQLLQFGQVAVTKTMSIDPPALLLTSADGSRVNFVLTWQSSGLVSVIIFCLLFVLLAFPLEGSLLRKIIVFQVGGFVGLLWCVLRLSLSVLLVYHFGEGAALLAGLFSPFVDFLWVVPIWALGLSAIISSGKRENKSVEP